MKPAREMFDHFIHKYDSGAELLPGQPIIEILGNCRVIAENHCGITCYSSHEIHVRAKQGIYLISGTGLHVAQMTNQTLVIVGKIESVRFCGGQKI